MSSSKSAAVVVFLVLAACGPGGSLESISHSGDSEKLPQSQVPRVHCAFGELRQTDGTCAESFAPLELPLDLPLAHETGHVLFKRAVPPRSAPALNLPPLQTVTAEAVLSLNGGPFYSDSLCNDRNFGAIHLRSPLGLDTSHFDIRCDSPPESTYPVTVVDGATLPRFVPSAELAAALGWDPAAAWSSSLPIKSITVTDSDDRATLDLRMRRVTGTLTFDGVPPALPLDCDERAGSIRFALGGGDLHTDLAVMCTPNGLRFNGWVATNQTYDVSVTLFRPYLPSTIWGDVGKVQLTEQ